MPTFSISTVLQVLLGLGLLNVWLLRATAQTRYRGGEAQSLREEFSAYRLPVWFFYVIGTLKVGCALSLLVGLWVPSLILPAAGLVVVLMNGAIAMHMKVGDPMIKALPAFLMLAMSAALCALQLTSGG